MTNLESLSVKIAKILFFFSKKKFYLLFKSKLFITSRDNSLGESKRRHPFNPFASIFKTFSLSQLSCLKTLKKKRGGKNPLCASLNPGILRHQNKNINKAYVMRQAGVGKKKKNPQHGGIEYEMSWQFVNCWHKPRKLPGLDKTYWSTQPWKIEKNIQITKTFHKYCIYIFFFF